jgi:3-oxoacyl-[acyl-carrier protein] reductase
MFDLTGKRALITGASGGIGGGVAEVLHAAGATVTLSGTREAPLRELAERLGARAHVVTANLGDAEAVEALPKAAAEAMGGVDILVNNAGITRDQLLMRMKDEEWDAIMDTNLKSVYRLSKAVLRGMMKARSGRIISIASVVGVSGNPGQCNYAAAKAAIIGFSKSLAREVGSRGITVNSVAPGFIDTDMTRALPEAQRAALVQQIALGRLGEAQDIADAVAFLASEQARYITGQTIHVNGGMLMP